LEFGLLHGAAVVAACLLCVAALWPLLGAPMLYDDSQVVAKDRYVAAVWEGRADVRGIFGRLWYQSRPVRLLTHRADALVFGKSLVGPHAENLLLHLAAGLLFASALGAMGVGKGVRVAALAIFLVHPVCVESVGILSHRKELLSALWMMAALRASLSRKAVWRGMAAAFLFLAVFSKETAAVFPALWALAVWERGRGEGGGKKWSGTIWRRAVFWVAASAGLAALAWWQIRQGMEILHTDPSLDMNRAGHFGGGAPWGVCWSAAIRSFPRYLLAFLTPWGHVVDPVFSLQEGLWSWRTLLALGVGAGYGAGLLALWRRRSRAFAPAAWIPAALAPYLFPPKKHRGHFFTIDPEERDDVILNNPNWKFEGIAYYVLKEPGEGTVPVYRFWSKGYKHHFYTMDENEKDDLIRTNPNWTYEKIAFYAIP
jgi:hypothetical protein